MPSEINEQVAANLRSIADKLENDALGAVVHQFSVAPQYAEDSDFSGLNLADAGVRKLTIVYQELVEGI